MDLVIRGERVVTSNGIHPASVHIADGRIAHVSGIDDVRTGGTVIDAGQLLVMPGLVDSHVHVNEPGRTEWEGFATATHAAAAGGITTIADMPLNSIPATTSVAALATKQVSMRESAVVNVAFIGGVVPGNSNELSALRDGGVCAFKCFLAPSGVDEFEMVTEQDLRVAFPILAKLGLPLMVHAESPAYLNRHPTHSRQYADYLQSRPVDAEWYAIEMLIRLVEWCPTPVHIVHLSSARPLALINDARIRGLPITVETCPHYLTFAAEEIPDGATEYKCAPPIRESHEREALWRALIAGDIDLVASDHSPCPPALKGTDGDFFGAWGGIASLQFSLASVWTGAHKRGVAPEQLAEWMSRGPAQLIGLGGRKGAIADGYDADIFLWNPDVDETVTTNMIMHRHKVTPYLGRRLHGRVEETFVGGRSVYSSGRLHV